MASSRSWLLILPLLISLPAAAERAVDLDVALTHPVLLADKKQTTYLKVGLRGVPRGARAPVNVAVVIDRSSSMNGEKIARAREAAAMIVDRLSADDVLSVVTYDSGVNVLIPATKLTDPAGVKAAIRRIQPSGSTALFAGLSRGVDEVRKFLDGERVNRVILLSDGQANVGPSSPAELGRFARAVKEMGVAISTVGLGLGYNEDLMSQLAANSDGNHAFVEHASELAAIFDLELKDTLSVVAQEVSVQIRLADNVRPVRALNREAEIQGQTVIFGLNQVYGGQEKYALLEIEVAPRPASAAALLAEVAVSYADLASGKTERLGGTAAAVFSRQLAQVEAAERRDVQVAAVEALAAEKNRLAVSLRDDGKVEEAQRLLRENSSYLEKEGKRLASPKLSTYGKINFDDAESVDNPSWNVRRKAMRKKQHEIDSQQSY